MKSWKEMQTATLATLSHIFDNISVSCQVLKSLDSKGKKCILLNGCDIVLGITDLSNIIRCICLLGDIIVF